MKILDMNILRGPNYWSNYRHHLIVMRLDIENLENLPTNKIRGFHERLEKLMPTLYEHHCSRSHKGGFFERVKEGTWMGHVIEHIALELQSMAGMPCGFGRTRFYGNKSVYNVVFKYQVESAGIYAGKAAVRIADALVNNIYYDIQNDVQELQRIRQKKGLGPSTAAIVEEAAKRNIPFRRLNDSSLVRLGMGVHMKKICAAMTSATSYFGVESAGDKEQTKRIMTEAFIPTPACRVVSIVDEMKDAIDQIGYPIVIKPINGNHGRGVTTNISTYADALKAFYLAQNISEEVIIEKFVQGYDFRFLVINYKLVAVARRTPAMVIGDGKSSIKKLIDLLNSDPKRGDGHEKVLTTVKIDEVTQKILAQNHLTLDSVLPLGQVQILKDTANISTGGTATDVTDQVHPRNVMMAERISRLLGLDICGIDVMALNVDEPITNQNGGVLEVNACPGLRMHLNPSSGLPRNVARPIVDMLFPEGQPSRIPIIAVTGTNGKTTTVRLLSQMAMRAGHKVGYTTTDGIYIQGQQIFSGDCSGPSSADAVLGDPLVDFAVLECARGGILRSGLGFDACNVSVITNVSDDHLGSWSINTLEEMADVKRVVAESTMDNGTSVLNADDDLVYKMAAELTCKVALFSVQENNPRIREHADAGGLVAYIEEGFVKLRKGDWKITVENLNNIPITFSGKAESMVKNVLAATLAAFVENFRIEDIAETLRSFMPSPEHSPGRMNVFSFRKFDIMIDYAHNPGGLIELQKFLDRVQASSKIGIITAVGDRRDQDIRSVGYYSGNIFDKIIIRHDKDLRGRSKEEITDLLMEGILSADPTKEVTVISDEKDAIHYAMDNCPQGAFIVVCTDSVKNSLDFIAEEKKKEEEFQKNPQFTFSEAS
jgi:cyanophycin synthetase